jgi:2-haloalkanoic acid dehalogenase type II
MGFKLDRREFLVAAGAGGMAMSFPALPAVLAQQATGGSVKPKLANVKACVFDTFGTVVDWRGSVIAEATSWGKAKGLNINWAEVTDNWRLGYVPAMEKVRKGEIPWTNLDDLNRMTLEDVLRQYKIEGLSEEEKTNWAHVWRRLKPWPDSIEGLGRLKKKCIISPLSNGNVALMTNMAKFRGSGVAPGSPRSCHYSDAVQTGIDPAAWVFPRGRLVCSRRFRWRICWIYSVSRGKLRPHRGVQTEYFESRPRRLRRSSGSCH